MFQIRNPVQIAFKSAWRNLQKHFSYNLLNILGLALTFGTLILIFCYWFHEKNFESFHENRDRIFRTTYQTSSADFSVHWARVPVDYINQLPEEIPEIEKLIRFQNQEQKYFRVGEKRFKPKYAYITDPDVFEVFSFKLIAGDPETALKDPYSVVLTKSEAIKVFSQTDIIGQEIHVTGDWTPEEQTYTVTGIMDDLPSNTHLPVNMLFSFTDKQQRSGWAYIYVLLNEQSKVEDIEPKMSGFIDKYGSDPAGPAVEIAFQPLNEIHLHSQLAREIRPNGQRIYLTIFFWFGLFVWVIALINFSNNHLALTLSRGKEVGVRKVLGAGRYQIAWQIFGESFFFCLTGLVLGILLAWWGFPHIQEITEISTVPPTKIFLAFLLTLLLISSTISALFPVVYATSIQIIQALKYGQSLQVAGRNRKINLRKGLISIQLCAALMLVTAAFITYDQSQFIRKKNLGFSKDQILAIPSVPDAVVKDYPLFKEQVEKIAGVSAVAACMQVPSDEIRDTGPVLVKGKNQDPNQAAQVDIQIIDPAFPQVMQLKVLAGLPPDPNSPLDRVPEFNADLTPADYLKQESRQYIINETALKKIGWNDPNEAIGQEINFSIGGFELAYGPITAVIEDYHQESLRNKIDPVIMVVEPIWLQTFLIKLNPQNLDQTLAEIESTWNGLFPYNIDYHFLDELFETLYRQDRVQVKLLGAISLLAVVISMIGLISLLAYSLKKRAKELAIRRVIGANQFDLLKLVGREYLFVFIVAALVCIPITIYWGQKWLANFAYHTSLNPLTFMISCGSMVVILAITITWQTKRNTVKNPVQFLRDE
ncbi:MAG: ABC transporter permease [Saprospiraceae bacterium]|nr:ABC transporter permease [Saprospiraceae bacterium]